MKTTEPEHCPACAIIYPKCLCIRCKNDNNDCCKKKQKGCCVTECAKFEQEPQKEQKKKENVVADLTDDSKSDKINE